MADDIKQPEHKAQYLNKKITPIGRLSHVHLAKPDTYKGKTKFKATVLIKKDAPGVDALKKEVTDWAKTVFKDVTLTKTNYGNPFKDGDKKKDKEGNPDKAYAGCWYLAAAAKEDKQPVSVGPGGSTDIIAPTKVLSGLNGRLKVSFCSYVGIDKVRNNDGDVETQTTYGVTALLDAVQITGGGTPFGGGGSSADGLDAVSPGEMDGKPAEDGDI